MYYIIFQLQLVTFNSDFLPNGWNFINKTTNKTDPSIHRTNFFQPRFAKVNTTLASFVWPYLSGFYENRVVMALNLFEVQSACFKGEEIENTTGWRAKMLKSKQVRIFQVEVVENNNLKPPPRTSLLPWGELGFESSTEVECLKIWLKPTTVGIIVFLWVHPPQGCQSPPGSLHF